MLLDDLRTELARQSEQVPAGVLEPAEVLTRTVRRVRRRRLARVAAVTATIVAIVAVVVVALNRSTSDKQIVVAAPTTTVQPRPIAAMPDAQLRAHLGDGVPAGWQPVDFGDARVFVPSGWIVEGVGECVGSHTVTGVVSLGQPLRGTCEALDRLPASSQAVSFIGLTKPPSGALVRVVHGYRVYAGDTLRRNGDWTGYEVPELGVLLATNGSLQNRILDTLAPSSRKVALAFADQPVPSGHVVTTDGITLTIPTAWTVTTPAWLPCNWLRPFPGSTPELARIRPDTVLGNCPMIPANFVRAHHDGVDLYTSPDRSAPPKEYRRKIVVLHHGATTIHVYSDIADASVLDLVIQRADSSLTHVLQLGLGRDGRVAGGVLASLRVTS